MGGREREQDGLGSDRDGAGDGEWRGCWVVEEKWDGSWVVFIFHFLNGKR